MSTARTGYEALEALTDGTITDEERQSLSARAAESAEWAAAMKAHAPPSAARREQMVDGILRVLDEEKVVSLSARRTSRGSWIKPLAAVVAIAAGVATFSMFVPQGSRSGDGARFPAYAASREGAAMCAAGEQRGVAPPVNGDCNLFVVRPETSFSGDVEAVRAYDLDAKSELVVARFEKLEAGVLHVYLGTDVVAKRVAFAIGAPSSMPTNFDDAMKPSTHFALAIVSAE